MKIHVREITANYCEGCGIREPTETLKLAVEHDTSDSWFCLCITCASDLAFALIDLAGKDR